MWSSSSQKFRILLLQHNKKGPLLWSGPLLFSKRLEGNPAADLPEPRLVGSSSLPETSVRKIGVNVCVVCAVEDIEKFKPQLEVDPLGYVCVLIEVYVGLVEVWSPEAVRFFVTFLPERRDCEIACGYSARKPTSIVSRLAVARRVGEVEVVAVRVEVPAPRSVADGRIAG